MSVVEINVRSTVHRSITTCTLYVQMELDQTITHTIFDPHEILTMISCLNNKYAHNLCE